MSDENVSFGNVVSPVSAVLRGLGRNLILRGALELAIGIMLLVSPLVAIRALTTVVGALLVIDGLVLFWVTTGTAGEDRFWTFVNASVLVVFGVLTVSSPLFMDRLWIVALGVWQIFSALSELIGGGWRRFWGVFSGIVSLIVGAIFIVLPFVGLTFFAVFAGCVMIASGFVSTCAGMGLRHSGGKI